MNSTAIKNNKNDMKIYVLTVSRTFPVTHKRKGELTKFPEKILGGTKIHTIRANYEFWKRRIDEVNLGHAIVSLRYWSGKPYNSKQVEIRQFKQGEIGCQELIYELGWFIDNIDSDFTTKDFANNDGLTYSDFKEWFKKYDLSKPMAIIHFTNFRY